MALIVVFLFVANLAFLSFYEDSLILEVLFIGVFYSIVDMVLNKLGVDGGRLVVRLALSLGVIIYEILMHKRSGKRLSTVVREGTTIGVIVISAVLVMRIMVEDYFLVNYGSYVLSYLIFVIIPYFIARYSVVNAASIKKFPLYTVALGIVFTIAFFLFANWQNIMPGSRSSIYESTERFDSISLSRILSLVIVALVVLILNPNNESKKTYIGIPVLLIYVYLLLFVPQRGTIIGVIIGLLLYGVFEKEKKKLAIVVTIGLVLLALLYLVDLSQFGILDRFLELKDYETFQRYDDYSISWRLFKTNPFFGIGPMGYFEKTGRPYPHNMMLELMVEYGILGVVAGLILLIGGWRVALDILKSNDIFYEWKAVAIMWIVMFTSAMVSSNLIGNSVFFMITGLIANGGKHKGFLIG